MATRRRSNRGLVNRRARKMSRVMGKFRRGTLRSRGRRVTTERQAVAVAKRRSGLSRRRRRR